jgi:hypothetical protein
MIIRVAVGVPALVLAAGCGGGGGDGAGVSIASPDDGATVESPFGVVMEAEDFALEPAGQVRAGAGHLHVVVDAAGVAEGDAIPDDSTHLHLGDAAREIEVDLPPGEHTLCAQAGDGAHVALDLTHEITIRVAGAG